MYVLFPLTQSQLLPGVRGQGEAQHRHGGDQEARHDQVEKIVESSSSDLDGEGDIQVRFGTAVVDDLITNGRHSWERETVSFRISLHLLFDFVAGTREAQTDLYHSARNKTQVRPFMQTRNFLN